MSRYGADLARSDGIDPTRMLAGHGRLFIGALAVVLGVLGQAQAILPGVLRPGAPKVVFVVALSCVAVIGLTMILLPHRLNVITPLLIVAADVQLVVAPWASSDGQRFASPLMIIFPVLFTAVLLQRWVFIAQCLAVFPMVMLGTYASYDRVVDWFMQGFFNSTALIVSGVGMFYVRRSAERSIDAVRKLSLTDPLTGLANRRRVEVAAAAFVGNAERAGQRVAAFVLDLDHFKEINDRFGHAVGDEVLREVASQLRGTMRVNDIGARMGGEEFVVLALVDDDEDVRRLADRLRAVVSGVRVATEDGPVRPTCSIGVAVGVPAAHDPEEWLWRLIDRADGALYSAKHQGRDRWVLVEPDRH